MPENDNKIDNSWPGEVATWVSNDGTYDCYKIVLPSGVTGFIVNGTKDDGSGATDQTPDILNNTNNPIENCTIYSMLWTDGNAVETKSDHDWNDGEVTKNPTCAEKGVKTYTCATCGDTKTEDMATLDHTPGEAVVENEVDATCTTAGSYDTVVRCTVCTTKLSSVTTTVPARNHDIVVDEAVDPTCTETGLTAGEHCSRCDYNVAQEVVPVTDHTWGEWIVDTEATEDAEGTQHRECENCDATQDGTIPTLDHVHSYNAVVTAPTCTEKGYTTHTCRCNDSYVDSYVDALGHDYESSVTKTATCTEAGIKTYTCKNDASHTYTETINATGHNYDGVEWKVEKAANYVEEGLETLKCNNCEYSYERTIPMKVGTAWYFAGSMNGWGESTDKLVYDKNGNASIEKKLALNDEFKIAAVKDGWNPQIGAGKIPSNVSAYFGGTDNWVVERSGTYKFTVDINGNITVTAVSLDTVVYLVPNSNWTQANARFAVYTWGGSAGEQWIDMVKLSSETNMFAAVLPAGYSNVIFCRMNPNGSNGWTQDTQIWNQTSDLSFTSGSNLYTVKSGTWSKGGGTWSSKK